MPLIQNLSSNTISNATIEITSIYYLDVIKSLQTTSGTFGSLQVNTMFHGGSGTNSSPFEISCARHLNNIRYAPSSTYKILEYSYIFVDKWTPIPYFTGVLDGNGNDVTLYTIENLAAVNIGFVAVNNGYIKNLSVVIAEFTIIDKENIPNEIHNIGCIAGTNNKEISNCTAGWYSDYIKINISTFWETNLGGLCGLNTENGNIYDGNVYYATLSVATGSVGGIAGKNEGRISRCNVRYSRVICYQNFNNQNYNSFYKSGHYGYAGGITGWNTYTISSCNVLESVEVWCGAFNYTGKDYSFAPEMGVFCGRSTSNPSNCSMFSNVEVYGQYLHTETWTTGALWWKENHSHDQAQYVGKRAVGHFV